MSDIQIQKAQCLCDLTDALPHYRKQLDRIDWDGMKAFLVHRLVAKAFIPNPDNLETVNHKDENTLNNRVDNLEYLSVADNIRYGTAIARRRLSQRKPVEQLTKDGKHIAYYDGIVDASIATGAPRELIGKVCHGRKKTAGGYRWKFKEQ